MSKKRNRHGQAGPATKKHKPQPHPQNHQHPSNPRATSKTQPQSHAHSQTPAKKLSTSTANPQHHNHPTIPFHHPDRILLVGEGDFSFAYSLLTHHAARFRELCATCYDSREELVRKYPQAEEYVRALLGEDEDEEEGEDTAAAVKEEEVEVEEEEAGKESVGRRDDGDGERYESDVEYDEEGNVVEHGDAETNTVHTKPMCSVLYKIDATKLHTYKQLRRRPARDSRGNRNGSGSGGGFTRIIFNFPHVGGKSKDVNRQVRYNQALLYSFFGSAKQLLISSSAPSNPNSSPNLNSGHVHPERQAQVPGQKQKQAQAQPPSHPRPHSLSNASTEMESPTILVTLFEGSPYTLWNIRDLARSAGLSVVRSWKFEAGVYPGYEHARTLGNLRRVGNEGKGRGMGRDGGGGAQGKEEQRGDDDDDDVEDDKQDENDEESDSAESSGEEEDDFAGFSSSSSDEGTQEEENEDVVHKEVNSSSETQKRPGRWRGEDRPARTYEFALVKPQDTRSRVKEEVPGGEDFAAFRENKKRKRKGGKLFDESDGDD